MFFICCIGLSICGSDDETKQAPPEWWSYTAEKHDMRELESFIEKIKTDSTDDAPSIEDLRKQVCELQKFLRNTQQHYDNDNAVESESE